MTTASRRAEADQGQGSQVRRPALHRHARQGTARHRARRKQFDEDKFDDGQMFDGSSIAGWKGIQESDMLLMPDPDDRDHRSVLRRDDAASSRCDVIEPADGKGYERDPRSLAKRAEAYLKSTGIGDTALLRPGDRVLHLRRRATGRSTCRAASCKIDSERGAVDLGQEVRRRQHGPPSRRQGRLLPGAAGRLAAGHPLGDVPGARSRWASRSKCTTTKSPTAGQCEIGTKFDDAGASAPTGLQILKYAMHNVAHAYGKTATFMPKPIVGDNGSGMHVHQSVWKGGKNLFAGDGYARPVGARAVLHRRHHQAREGAQRDHQPGHQQYKRLVPGFEAPVMLAYSARNRSASMPHSVRHQPEGRGASRCASRIRLRIRTSRFAAMMMAGLDGIQNKIHPGDPADKDLYDLRRKKPRRSRRVPSLDQALEHLDKDREFLTRGGVFTDDVIDAYIELKMQEVTRFRMTTHPVEFEMYYSL